MDINMLKTLCDYENGRYVSKVGDEYIAALGKLVELKNTNDKPFTIEDIKKEPLLGDFKFLGVAEFKHICNLVVEPMTIVGDVRRNERIVAKDFTGTVGEQIFNNALGVVYIITAVIDGNEHIIKIGCSRNTFKKRLQSYNCGCVNNWRTASTTNIKMLQSMVVTRVVFKLYLYDCSDENITYTWHGRCSVPFSSPKIYAFEDILVKEFIQEFGHKPLTNVQTNATIV